MRRPEATKAKLKAGAAALTGTATRAATRAGQVLGGGAVAGLASMGVAGSAAALSAAFAVGYGIGTLGKKIWQRFTPEERAFRRARAFREARLKFEERAGRRPTLEETKEIARGFDIGSEA